MINSWNMAEPRFESDSINEKLKLAYWVGHRYFAYDLINFMRPKKIVELGSQYGCSLFAMCQSIKDNSICCEMNAVDLWSGDIGAEHSGEEVFDIVNQISNKYFSNINVNLYQRCFDAALELFEDESIDIIHIDGNHEYEAVKHDFITWLPKLKENGIILFHDVYSPYEEGACIFWDEIKRKYEIKFEFKHSCGLGILFPKGDLWYREMEKKGLFNGYIDLYMYKSMYEEKDLRFEELEKLFRERYEIIQKQNLMIADRDNTIESNEQMIEDRDETIKSNEQMIKDRDETIKSNEQMIEERDNVIKNYEDIINIKDKLISEYEKEIDLLRRELDSLHSKKIILNFKKGK